MRRLRLAFMGTPEFAVPALQALAAAHEVACVYTQPPRPAGRGQAPRRSAVHAAADALGLPVLTPARLRDPAIHAAFAALALETAVVAAYGLILPPAILDAPARGCVNIHASLLPRWRGAAPIQAAILAGDAQSGVTIMRMEAGLDTGPMYRAEAVPIGPHTTASALHDALAALGSRLLLEVLRDWPRPVAQPEGATYAPKLAKADGRLDFARDAAALDRVVRALNPWPGVFTTLGQETLKVLAAEPAVGHGPPGFTLDDALTVGCGGGGAGDDRGALRLTRVQRAGRSPLDAAAFLRGNPVPPGTLLGA